VRAWVELVWDESEKEVTGRKPFFDRPIDAYARMKIKEINKIK